MTPLILKVLMTLIGDAPEIMQLLLSVFSEVHKVQAELPGAPGADKSASVIARVTPIANAVGAEVGQVQTVINQVVDVSKALGIGAFGNAGGG